MRTVTQLARQVEFDLLVFRRNPAASFFTVIMPLILLVLLTSVFGNDTLENGAKVSTVYVPGILTLAIVSATTVNLAITMTSRRERGMLKRLRATPLPPWIFLASQAVGGFVISIVMTIIIVVVGGVLYGVQLNLATLPTLILSLMLGAAAFSLIGLALTAVIPSEDAAPAITNACMLPLYFVSGVFVPQEQIPDWVVNVGDVFPIAHLNKALQVSFDPFVEGVRWPWGHWLVVAAWGGAAAIVAIRGFRWVPRR